MNFIFDIGNVLVDFKPRSFLNEKFPGELNETLREILYETIFASEEWRELDRGTLSHEEASEIFCNRRPENADAVNFVMASLEEMLTPIQKSIEFLPIIKGGGHGLYFLSNYHVRLREYILGKYSFFKLFDGGIFSCDVHINKPSPEIYRRLLERHSLKPSDCVFFDDTRENVDAAEREGIKSVLFTGADCLLPFIKQKPVLRKPE